MRGKITCRLYFLAAIACLLLNSCKTPEKEADPCCQATDLEPGTDVPSGQGALQVNGTADAYFYVFDADGRQVNYKSLNKLLALPPGDYQARVAGSSHSVGIRAGKLTTCATGGLLVTGSTSDYYYVLDTAQNQLSYDGLGKTTSLFQSSYFVKVNASVAPVAIEISRVKDVATGTILVHGTTDEYYYVLDEAGNQLNYQGIEKPLAFHPGRYKVKVNNSMVSAVVEGGRSAELTTGTLLVKGLTDEYYYVSDASGTQLNYQGLNKPLAFFPNSYNVKVNGSMAAATVVAGTVSSAETGSVVVPGTGDDYYYVLDMNGTQLNYSALTKPLSFFPGEYTVRLGTATRNVKIEPGREQPVEFR